MRYFSVFVLLLLSTLRVVGQQSDSLYQEEVYFEDTKGFYLRLGLNNAGVTGFGVNQPEVDRRMAISFGGGGLFSLTYNERYWLNAEVGISSQGFKFKNPAQWSDPESIRTTYLQFLGMLKYYPLPKVRNVYVAAGPQLGILIGRDMRTSGGGLYNLTDSGFKSPDISGVIAAGINLGHVPTLGLEVRYSHGFNQFLAIVPKGRHSVYQFNFFFPLETVQKIADVIPGINLPF